MMSKLFERILVGKEKQSFDSCLTQYEVDKYVADKRGTIAMTQVRTVLAKPAVLAAIFGAGALKEYKSDSRKNPSNKSTNLMKYVMLASRFI